ncbi:MAG: hypothetical protein PsegKO_35690 [Pseudohongiellaceae bacterium]|jgi:hypothetical protein
MINTMISSMNTRTTLIGALLLLLLAGRVGAAESDIENHPGYVDFSTLMSLTTSEPTVEISLKAPLLSMVTNLIRSEDEEAADFISKLLRVTVHVFESDNNNVTQMSDSMESISDDLDVQGWERVVRVREDQSHVDIYVRMSANAEIIHGLAIMVAEPYETVLVNIIGDISGNDLAALGRRFDIDQLQDLEVETN